VWKNVMRPSARKMLYACLGKRTGQRVRTGAVMRGDRGKIFNLYLLRADPARNLINIGSRPVVDSTRSCLR